jgi:23S rRNA pseudouridine1911/1915/1917 synthase
MTHLTRMDPHETIHLEQTLPNERLDRHLARLLPEVSRGTLRRLIDEGQIRVNDAQVKPTHAPRAGDVVTIHWPAPTALDLVPADIPLEILFEDSDMLVINKAPDIPVHPAPGHADGTLVHALLHHCRGQLSGIGGVERPGIVHRLDLETSGCLVVAKNDLAHVRLAEQFQERTIEKIYHALVCGPLEPTRGEIRANIARHPSHRKRMAIVHGGREAYTSYQRLEAFGGAAYVEIQLHTGRTHQIRVHFKHIGFPVLGDATYGATANRRYTERTGRKPGRQMLHARRLALLHPRTSAFMEFVAPFPTDFERELATLRSEAAPPKEVVPVTKAKANANAGDKSKAKGSRSKSGNVQEG